MGIKEDQQEAESQFISYTETIQLIAEAEGVTFSIAMRWFFDKNIIGEQYFLKKEVESTKITPMLNYFYNKESNFVDFIPEGDDQEIEKETIVRNKINMGIYCLNLKKLIKKEDLSKFDGGHELSCIGFARKRLYDTLTVNGVYIPPERWAKAKSFLPDDESVLTVEDYLNAHGAKTIECLEKRNDCEKERIELKTKNDILTLENSRLTNLINGHESQISGYESHKFKQYLSERESGVLEEVTTKKLTTKEDDSLVSILHILSHMQKIDLSNQAQMYKILSDYATTNRFVIPSKGSVVKFLKMAGYPTTD